jgi:hypothetical protein
MIGFLCFLQLFLIGHKPKVDSVCRGSGVFPDLTDLHITKNDYTDTTEELEHLLTDRYLLKRKAIEGVDERMMNDTQHGVLQEMQQIAMNARKYALLKILENPEITEVQKIEHITQHEKNGDSKNSQNSKYMSEIFKGILFSEW